MTTPRVILVEVEGLVGQEVTARLHAVGLLVETAKAPTVVEQLIAHPPELAVVNAELSQGSGFGLINRISRMEALAGLKMILLSQRDTEDALAVHQKGPTPAAGYVRAANLSSAAVTDLVAAEARRLLAEQSVAFEDAVRAFTEGDVGGALQPQPSEDKADGLAKIISTLGGYRVLRRLRDEDGGAVFACMDDELGRAVAIKTMATGTDAQAPADERLQRFQRERRILALLHSPHIISVYGAGSWAGTPYLVRELIDGESLAGQIAREGGLDPLPALNLVRQVALGLQHAAQVGVIHRDVRPENIFALDGKVKLAGFGMGKRLGDDEVKITQGGIPLPDTTYVAPERVRGEEDLRGDIYALGVTLHTLIAGTPPFRMRAPVNAISGKRMDAPIPLGEARPGAPPQVAALITRMISERPQDRPRDWAEVLTDVDELRRELGGAAAEPRGPDEPSAVHGTLKLMSVLEIVQSLELSRKTALVTITDKAAAEGRLAFDGGRLTFATVGTVSGDEAFFALAQRTSGGFRVDYPAQGLSVSANVSMPTTALLLEAARRTDVAAAGGTSVASGPALTRAIDRIDGDPVEPVPLSAQSPFDIAPGSTPFLDAPPPPPAFALPRPPRQVSASLGFVAIAVVATLFSWVGMQLPAAFGEKHEPDPAATATAELLAGTRRQLTDARARLAELEPQLRGLKAAQESTASATAAAREKSQDVKEKLSAALAPEIQAGRIALRVADDGRAVIVEIADGMLFLGDDDEVGGDGVPLLARVAGAIAGLGELSVRVEGHSDGGTTRGKHKNNWGASGAHALAVRQVLLAQGLKAAQVTAIARADSAPLTGKKRSKNRRVELHVQPTAT